MEAVEALEGEELGTLAAMAEAVMESNPVQVERAMAETLTMVVMERGEETMMVVVME